ncbi:VHS domain-containing protein [Rhizoctonia solani AG-1 IA]|uniref:VHS domain-containing protein n=1 Tax=Thanatephorus cucumeris (strain AG1-IA) TaxID=983506 RepID=L8WI33_THACA|nr:VHS domain-containing protein [Rhizoctonia solani AG-1 IA]
MMAYGQRTPFWNSKVTMCEIRNCEIKGVVPGEAPDRRLQVNAARAWNSTEPPVHSGPFDCIFLWELCINLTLCLNMLQNSWNSISPVELMVQRACDPSLHEPNYALNLELVEYIKKKKANTPREAAMAIVHNINHRNPHVSILALNLLQTLVNSLGHLFHLQIATKEFLNELVRRFPERPPPFPGPIMTRILDLIHEWRETICKESRWKEDLGNIKDMHRLLGYKGLYIGQNDPGHTHSLQGIDSGIPEELEQEDRDAQSAVGPKLFAGKLGLIDIHKLEITRTYSKRNTSRFGSCTRIDEEPFWSGQCIRLSLLTETNIVSRIPNPNQTTENKPCTNWINCRPRLVFILLYLQGEKFAKGDAYDQVAGVLRQARPKIQKWIGEAEEGDPESLG